MSAIQTELDRSRPHSRCFSGGGDVAAVDKPVGYFQHGLYFGHDGKLLADHPYNAEKMALLAKLGMNPEAAVPGEQEQAEERKPVNPLVVAALEERSDEELAQTGAKLNQALVDRGDAPVELPTERDALIRLIAEYTS